MAVPIYLNFLNKYWQDTINYGRMLFKIRKIQNLTFGGILRKTYMLIFMNNIFRYAMVINRGGIYV